MNKRMFVIMLVFLAAALPMSAMADDAFNGSKPFVCAVIDANECGANEECKRVSIEDIDCPRFLKVNLTKKMIIGTMADQTTREVEIQNSAHVEGNLVLQGAQKGRVWCLIISEETGKMTLTVSGQGECFAFFGASFIL
jgi:hypothetical protein